MGIAERQIRPGFDQSEVLGGMSSTSRSLKINARSATSFRRSFGTDVLKTARFG